MSKYILGIDEGTTSVRAGLYNVQTNTIENIISQPIQVFCPHDGWVEQDGEKIYTAVCEVINQVISNINTSDILAISITNQRETTVAWDKLTGECVYPVINWQCRRTKSLIDTLTEEQKREIKNITGLIPDAYFSASKMKWLEDNQPQVKQLKQQNRLCFGTIESYLIYKLTKGKSFVTDATNASRTMLMNLQTFLKIIIIL